MEIQHPRHNKTNGKNKIQKRTQIHCLRVYVCVSVLVCFANKNRRADKTENKNKNTQKFVQQTWTIKFVIFLFAWQIQKKKPHRQKQYQNNACILFSIYLSFFSLFLPFFSVLYSAHFILSFFVSQPFECIDIEQRHILAHLYALWLFLFLHSFLHTGFTRAYGSSRVFYKSKSRLYRQFACDDLAIYRKK